MVSLARKAAAHRSKTVQGSQEISREIGQAIFDQVYSHGERLPTEREMALTFGASRTTVRKALALLESQKLVSRRAGSGTYVSFQASASETDIAERTSPLELIEVREAIEPQIARLAVLHASAVDLERLQGLVRILIAAEKANDAESYAAADEQFHLALASATSNPLLVWLYQRINDIRTHALWGEMRQKIITAENMRIYNNQHAAIVRAVQVRDAVNAAETMVQHMQKARNDLVGAHSR
jgi:DNA-binding FadR family transcriptional regulator